MWNNIQPNRVYQTRELAREHMLHGKKVQKVKANVDNNIPNTFKKLRNNSRTSRINKERQQVIQYENRILLNKMLNVGSQLNLHISKPPISGKSMKSLNSAYRNKELKRISTDNQRILSRLQSAKGVYNFRKWDQEYEHKRYLTRKLSENSGRVPKSLDFNEELYENIQNQLTMTRPGTARMSGRDIKQRSRPQTAKNGRGKTFANSSSQ